MKNLPLFTGFYTSQVVLAMLDIFQKNRMLGRESYWFLGCSSPFWGGFGDRTDLPISDSKSGMVGILAILRGCVEIDYMSCQDSDALSKDRNRCQNGGFMFDMVCWMYGGSCLSINISVSCWKTFGWPFESSESEFFETIWIPSTCWLNRWE